MTVPKVSTIKRQGSRLYVDPETGEKAPGVTSVLNMLPKPFLKFWAAKLVAETAVDNAASWIGLALAGDRDGAVDYLKRSPMRNTGAAASRGTDAHDIFETMSLGKPVGRVHPDMEIFVRHFSEFLDTFQPEYMYTEGTVWNDSPAYAGSFDFIATIGHELVIGDYKTTRSGVFPEVALQLAAYAAADNLMAADGVRTPMPALDGACVVHIVPDGWKLVPVVLDADLLVPIFESLLKVWEWDRTISKGVLGDPVSAADWVSGERDELSLED